jgi:AraC-like DNA-binding protein
VDDFNKFPKYMFFESVDSECIHYVQPLLVMLEGSSRITFYQNGVRKSIEVSAPAVLYCSLNGSMQRTSLEPSKTLSFSYYPTYMRCMLINYDGVHAPPTPRDIFYHTRQPLSHAGNSLIAAIDNFYADDMVELAKDMLPVLYKVTLHDMEASAAAAVSKKAQSLWEQINSFLREHRNEQFSRYYVAKLFCIAPGYLSEICKKFSGKSFSELKLCYQMEHAVKLLLNTRLSVDEIAQQTGFSCSNYFIRRFKSLYHTTPHIYRNTPSD